MTQDDKYIERDRLRFIKNTQSANLCYIGILLDVFFFVNIYKSDVGTYYYNWLIGASIVYNLCFMLAAFLASEGVKNYAKNYSYLLGFLGIMQIVRIFIIPMKAHSSNVVVNGVETLVMTNGQFTRVVIYLVISACALICAAFINLQKCKQLEEHMKTVSNPVA
jgi:hypothetical protein